MLVLQRQCGQKILIGAVTVEVIRISGRRVKLGIHAPDNVPIVRDEILPDGLDVAEYLEAARA